MSRWVEHSVFSCRQFSHLTRRVSLFQVKDEGMNCWTHLDPFNQLGKYEPERVHTLPLLSSWLECLNYTSNFFTHGVSYVSYLQWVLKGVSFKHILFDLYRIKP